MKTKRKSVKSRKTQKQKFGGAEKNKILKKGSDIIYIQPLLWSKVRGFSSPEFITQDGVRNIEIDGYAVFIFIRLSNKWYAMASDHTRGVSIITLLVNSLAKIHLFEMPEFRLTDGIITNLGKIIQIDNKSPVFDKLMQIKKDIGFVNF
jgi:hypothetical protein